MASIKKRENGQWRARYSDEGGREHSRHFTRKVDAQRWLDETTASVVTGQYVNPKAGQVTVREYAEQWRAAQAHREGTVVQVEGILRRHVYPVLGDRPISSVLPSDVQSLVKRLSQSRGLDLVAPSPPRRWALLTGCCLPSSSLLLPTDAWRPHPASGRGCQRSKSARWSRSPPSRFERSWRPCRSVTGASSFSRWGPGCARAKSSASRSNGSTSCDAL